MNKAMSVGLIGAGSLSASPLTRFWALPQRLGPVKSASFRVASRLANMLRAGYPVKDYTEFKSCILILIAVPEEAISQVVSEMLDTDICWQGKAVVLCSTWRDSGELCRLAARGAAVGSLSPIPGFDDYRYLVEGDSLAVRESKRLVENRERRVVAIERPLKPFYLAALTCSGSLLFALLRVGFESLHHAGIPPGLSATVLERQISRTLRSFLKGGKRAYAEPRELSAQLGALSGANPELAYYLEQSCRVAARLMEKQPSTKARAAAGNTR